MSVELVMVLIMSVILSVIVFIDQRRQEKRNISEPLSKKTQSHYEYTQTKEMPALDYYGQ